MDATASASRSTVVIINLELDILAGACQPKKLATYRLDSLASQLTSRTLMTGPYLTPGPAVSPANPRQPLLEPTTSPGYPPPGYVLSAPARSDYASWSKRVRARLIDQLPTYLGLIIFGVGYLIFLVRLASSGGSAAQFEGPAVAMIIGLGVMLASLGWIAYNRWHIAGKTGQSLGKRTSKITMIGEETNAPIGPRYAFIRDLVHILDALTLVGYLWPLWDDKRQSFADQVMKTVVIDQTNSRNQ